MTNENVQSLCPVIPGKTNGSSWYQTTTSWWLNQPIWKMWVKLGIFPIWRVKIKNLWNHHQTNKMLSSESCIHPPLPPCLRFLEGVVFSTWWNNNPVMDMKEKRGVFQWKKVVRFIMFCKSSYAESYFVVVLLFFPGWKEGKHSGKCNRVCFGWWNKIKNKKDSQRMHRKKRMHSRIYIYIVICGHEYYQKLSNSNPSMVKLWKKVLISFAAFCSSFHRAAAVAKSKAIQDFSIFQNLCRFLTHPHK